MKKRYKIIIFVLIVLTLFVSAYLTNYSVGDISIKSVINDMINFEDEEECKECSNPY